MECQYAILSEPWRHGIPSYRGLPLPCIIPLCLNLGFLRGNGCVGVGALTSCKGWYLGQKQKARTSTQTRHPDVQSFCCNPRADATSKIPIAPMQHTKKERLVLKVTDMIHRQNFNKRFQQRCIFYVPGTASTLVLPASPKL